MQAREYDTIDPRKRTILKAVVRDYVLTAEPVGSRTLARRYDLGLSPATIRNELADLEAVGLIRQPHTSSGRIPSDSGYRFFVDHLMERNTDRSPDPLEEARLLSHDLQELLLQTAKMTAVLAGCTAIVRAPRIGTSRIKHLQLVSVGEQEAMLVMITDRGGVSNQFLRLPSRVSSDELQSLSNFLNAHLKGQQINGLTKEALRRACLEMRDYQEFLGDLCGLIQESVSEKVYLAHTSFLAQQPEFEVGRLGPLLDFLEREQQVADLLDGLFGSIKHAGFVCGTAKVIIGSENPHPDLRDCSLVSAPYSVGDLAVGEVGVIGPTRMDYARAIQAIEAVSEQLTAVLSSLLGAEGEEKHKR